ncbi:MAG: hypothetical protein PVSMB9_07530 [Candidatus Dormibacteria bacterium]
MSFAFRVLVVIAFVATAIVILAGPAWRGSFYRSWLRPRMVAFGIIVALLATASYVYRVLNAIRAHG